MGKVICFINQKGGVGKTTSSNHMAYILAKDYNKKVLIIDFDGQGNTSKAFGILEECKAEDNPMPRLDDLKDTVADIMNYIIMKDEIPDIKKYIRHLKGVDVIPANNELSMFENNLVNVEFQREQILKRLVDAVKNDYDYVIIDGLPKLSLQMINILFASDEAIIPTPCAMKSIDGLYEMIKVINKVKKHGHPSFKIAGLLITVAQENTIVFKTILEDLYKYFKDFKIFTPVIPYSRVFEEADYVGQLWIERDPKHKISNRFKEFVAEYMKGEE